MRSLILVLLCMLVPGLVQAAAPTVPLQRAGNELGDVHSLQRGARLFVNYCLSCHSASAMRFSRIAQDLGLSDEAVMENLAFTAERVGDTMDIAMTREDGEAWFGVAPPDLSVVARARGVDWLYTYLLTFYLDPAKPTGVNNQVFPDVAMPHVLGHLQGWQRAVYRTELSEDGSERKVVERLETTRAGQLSAAEYEQSVRDLVNFLDYLGEPAKLVRYRLGFWVIGFLLVLAVITYLLKREYWRDVH